MEILGIFLLTTLGGITIIALFGVIALLFPKPIEKTRLNLENSLGRSFLLGLVNFIFFIVLVATFSWLSPQTGQFFGGIFLFLAGAILLGLVIFGLLGLTAFANMLGERMSGDKPPFVTNLRGGILLLLAGFAPYVGWFLFTPLVLWTGLGGAISALLRRGEKPAPLDEAI